MFREKNCISKSLVNDFYLNLRSLINFVQVLVNREVDIFDVYGYV